ncbi:MAG: hydrogenase 2 operon protein HybA [Proteobacteria bacterium]|nr:hydrogenase 2 operon protein HybA [Pseudomonadota bacterium]MBU1710817.1 hydrogenase 2 operon protein HybA [Pseudomonadota bacterium]
MKVKRRDFLKGVAAGGTLAALGKPDLVGAHERGDRRDYPSLLGMLYDATLCVGCQVCMVACKKANNMPYEHSGLDRMWDNPRDLSSSTLNIIKKYSIGGGDQKDNIEGHSFIKRHCMHCIDASCVSACPVSAMSKDKMTGMVTYNKDACIGCRYCQIACPFNIPKFEWETPVPKIVKCQLCSHLIKQGGISACCEACPTGASLFGPVESLVAEARRRMAMIPGTYYDFPVADIGGRIAPKFLKHRAANYVNSIYGEHEVGGTQVMYLSGVPFEKLGLPGLPDESFAKISDGIQYAIYKGMVYPIVVLGGLIYMIGRKEEGDKKK